MTGQPEPTSVREKVLETISRNNVRMRPKWHFVLRALLLVVGVAILCLGVMYLTSFILFFLRYNGMWLGPQLGLRGWFAFLRALPWLIIVLIAVFIVVVEVLVRKYAFAYRRPLVISAVGVVAVVVCGGFIISRTPLHHRMVMLVERHPVPVAGQMYRGMRNREIRGIFRGQMGQYIEGGFELSIPPDRLVSVRITDRTRMPRGPLLVPGDMIVVFGEHERGVIFAWGVDRIPK